MPCFAAKRWALPGVGEATAKTSASEQRLSERVWMWETNCDPMMPTLILLFMGILRAAAPGVSQANLGPPAGDGKTSCADHSGVVAEFRLHHLDTVLRDLRRARDLPVHGRGENIEVFLADPAPKNDPLRQESVDQRPRGCGGRIHGTLDDRGGPGIAGRGGKDDVAVREAKRLSRRGERRAGREGFPAAARAAVTIRAVGPDGNVAQFGMFPVPAAINLSIHQDRTADASAERDHYERARTASGAKMKLAKGGSVGIVFEPNRDLKPIAQRRDEVRAVPPRQRVGIMNRAALRIHRTGAADPDARQGREGPVCFLQHTA